jgi:hypothetical protein
MDGEEEVSKSQKIWLEIYNMYYSSFQIYLELVLVSKKLDYFSNIFPFGKMSAGQWGLLFHFREFIVQNYQPKNPFGCSFSKAKFVDNLFSLYKREMLFIF